MHHDLLLVKPYFETRGGLVKFTDIKIVNKHIGKDGAKKLGVLHDAKVHFILNRPHCQLEKSADPILSFCFVPDSQEGTQKNLRD